MTNQNHISLHHAHRKKQRYPDYSSAWLDDSVGGLNRGSNESFNVGSRGEENLPVFRDRSWRLYFRKVLEFSSPDVARRVIDQYVMIDGKGDPNETNTHRAAIANGEGYEVLTKGLSKHPERAREMIRAFSGYPYNWDLWVGRLNL